MAAFAALPETEQIIMMAIRRDVLMAEALESHERIEELTRKNQRGH